MALRLFRIAGIAAGLAYLFDLSHRAGIARGNEEVPGVIWAIAVVTLIFLLRAVVTELATPDAHATQKDLLWGITAGGIITILLRTGLLTL